MNRKEAVERIKTHMIVHQIGTYPHIKLAEALSMAIEALQEPGLSYEEIMVGDIIKNFGCEYEVHSISHIKDELFISAYRIGGEEE